MHLEAEHVDLDASARLSKKRNLTKSQPIGETEAADSATMRQDMQVKVKWYQTMIFLPANLPKTRCQGVVRSEAVHLTLRKMAFSTGQHQDNHAYSDTRQPKATREAVLSGGGCCQRCLSHHPTWVISFVRLTRIITVSYTHLSEMINDGTDPSEKLRSSRTWESRDSVHTTSVGWIASEASSHADTGARAFQSDKTSTTHLGPLLPEAFEGLLSCGMAFW